MLRLDQKVNIECTDTGAVKQGKIVRIKPNGIDVAIDEFIIRLIKQKPHVYIGNQSGMEFIVRTDR